MVDIWSVQFVVLTPDTTRKYGYEIEVLAGSEAEAIYEAGEYLDLTEAPGSWAAVGAVLETDHPFNAPCVHREWLNRRCEWCGDPLAVTEDTEAYLECVDARTVREADEAAIAEAITGGGWL